MLAKCFLDLPNDILLCLQEFLTPNENACLALCNHGLKNLLGRRRKLEALAQQYEDYFAYSGLEAYEFSELLARDHPQYFACHECGKLHLKTSIEWPNRLVPGKRAQTLKCLEEQEELFQFFLPRLHSGYFISFYHVQLALENHRSGKGIPLEAFTHTELGLQILHSFDSFLSIQRVSPPNTSTDLFSVEARISDNELLLRTQIWIILPFSLQGWHSDYRNSFPTACEHIPYRNRYQSLTGIDLQIKCRLYNLDKGGSGQRPKYCQCQLCGNGENDTVQCDECYMEYQLDMKTIKWGNAQTTSSPKHIAITVTRWLNLGSGRSI